MSSSVLDVRKDGSFLWSLMESTFFSLHFLSYLSFLFSHYYRFVWENSINEPSPGKALTWHYNEQKSYSEQVKMISKWTSVVLCVYFGHSKTVLCKRSFKAKALFPAVTLGQAQLSILTCQLERLKKMTRNWGKKFNLWTLERVSDKWRLLCVQYGVERKIWANGKN